MKIAFISKEYPPSPRSYGIGTYVWESARALAMAGHHVTVLCASDDVCPVSDVTTDGLRVIRLFDDENRDAEVSKVRQLLTAPARTLRYRRRVADALNRLVGEDEVELAEFQGYRGESFSWCQSGTKVPLVVRVHGWTAWINRRPGDYITPQQILTKHMESKELLAADHITVVAQHLRSAVCARIPESKVTVQHNGVDTEWWRLKAERGGAGLEPNDILFVGSLTAVKGVFTLINASEALRSRGKWDGNLVLAGRMSKAFRRFCLDRWQGHPPSWLLVRGHVEREALPSLYCSAGACCFPSHIEPFNFTSIEAMASGGLVIGTNGTGMEESIGPEAGVLVPPRDVGALTHALETVLALPQSEKQRLRSAAFDRAHKHLDSGSLAGQTVQLYEQVIAGQAPRGSAKT